MYSAATGHAERTSPNAGKWLLFVECARAATAWNAVRRTFAMPGSAEVAQVSTEDKATLWPRKFKPAIEHVIEVHTRDWRDTDDVLAVGLRLLKAADADTDIYYKADEQTRAGDYAFGGPVALYRLRPPYVRLEPARTLIELARSHVDAARALKRIRNR